MANFLENWVIKCTHYRKFNDNLIKMLAKNPINMTLDGIFSLDPEFLFFRSTSGAVGKPGALFYHFLGRGKKWKKGKKENNLFLPISPYIRVIPESSLSSG
jgi:hypothetical protein